jgi:hypothetical protein
MFLIHSIIVINFILLFKILKDTTTSEKKELKVYLILSLIFQNVI